MTRKQIEKRFEKIDYTKTYTETEAWQLAGEIFRTDYEQDYDSSDRAGYPIYRSTVAMYAHDEESISEYLYDQIADLGCRLAVMIKGVEHSISYERTFEENKALFLRKMRLAGFECRMV